MTTIRKQLFLFLMLCLSLSSVATAAIYPVFDRDTNGNAVAVWIDYNEEDEIKLVANTYVGGTWGTPAILLDGGIVTQSPVIAVRAVDTDEIAAVVVWADSAGEGQTGLYSAMLPTSDGSWTSPGLIPLADENESVNSDYVVRTKADGTAVLVYTSYDFLTGAQPVKSATATIDSFNTWSTPVIISD